MKIFRFGTLIALAAGLMCSCKEPSVPAQPEPEATSKTVNVCAVAPTALTLDRDIALMAENDFVRLKMGDDVGMVRTVYSGQVGINVHSSFALYPYSDKHARVVGDKGEIVEFDLPTVYEDYVSGNNVLPMYAGIEDVDSGENEFKMTTGAVRVVLKGVPGGTASVVFATERAIAGRATLNAASAQAPVLEGVEGSQSVTFHLKEPLQITSDLTVLVPLPVGEYKALAVDIKDKDGVLIKSINKLSGITSSLAHIQVMTLNLGGTDAVSLPSTGLPTVVVVTPGKSAITSKEIWTEGALYVIRTAEGKINAMGLTSVRGRGNSTWGYPKKPYALKLDSKTGLLGMNKHKRWVLLANWMDRTIMRNAVAFEIARKSPALSWTPSGRYVEVVLNGKHLGNYYLCEQIKVDKNRVNVAELDAAATSGDAITGGYLMELDTYYDETYKFHSARRSLPWMFKDPDEVNTQQLAYMQGYVNAMENALYDNTKFAAREFQQYMELESFADWWFVHELTMNWEPNHPKSTYMHKDKVGGADGGKIVAGPVWDFDWETFKPDRAGYFIASGALYYDKLLQDESFRALVKKKWQAQVADYRAVDNYIDELARQLTDSEAINHQMWPLGSGAVNGDGTLSFSAAVARLKKSYDDKLNWMNSQITAW